MKQRGLTFRAILALMLVLLIALPATVGAQDRTGETKGGNVSLQSVSVSDTPTPMQLAQLLVGTGPTAPTISNVTYTGDSRGSGSFSGGTGIVGLESGVILGSGRVIDVVGPNTGDATTWNFGLPGDSDLDGLIPGYSTNDATLLEFDFECPGGTGGEDVISFYYVFTSEEYNEYVNTAFNDVFGFFLNGTNIALLPDGVTPVSINNVNNGYSEGGGLPGTNPSNPTYYINNDLQDGGGSIDIEADGLTVVLGAQANINPGVTNHMKLAIADAGDHILDSWVFLEEGSFQCAPLPDPCAEPDTRTYTVDADFAEGTLVNVNYTDVADQLQLDSEGTAFEFIWVAASGRGTIIKIDTVSGAILGEYWSAPQDRPKNPSRTTVDNNGNVWAGNRNESTGGKGSVVHIGLQENGQCVDRNSNGVIDTSTGLGDIRAWSNTGGADTNGGVSTAQDECIIHYVRTSGTNVRTVAVDANNDVWVGGLGNRVHEKIDGATGAIVPGTTFNQSCGGYGGLIDGNGILWSSGDGQYQLLRYDPATSTGSCIHLGRWAYGLGIDTTGHIWHSNYSANTIAKISPGGAVLAYYTTYGASGDRGVAVTPADDNIWVANSWGSDVSRLRNDGSLVTTIGVGNMPTGVAVDAAGKVWVTNYSSHNAMRIDPATNLVDLTVPLGSGAFPYNYSDMTGATLIAPPNIGTWTVVRDSGIVGAYWREVSWNSSEPGDSSISVKVASSDDGVTFGPEVPVTNGGDPGVQGQYLKVIVSFSRASTGESPILYDLTIATNQHPEVTADAASVTVDEGVTATNTGTVSDADDDTVTLTASVGTVTNNGDGTWSWSFDTEDGPTDSQTVTIYATDGYGCVVEVTFELTVNNVPPAVTVDIGSQTVQYSDYICDVTFTATDVAADTMTATTSPSTLPDTLTFTANGCSDSGGIKTCTWTLAGTMDQPVGDYGIIVIVTDDDGGTGSADTTVTVVHEDADIWLDEDNQVAVEVDADGDSPAFSLTAYVQETSDPDAADCGADPGDINNAQVEMTLAAVGPGDSYTVMCTPVGTAAADDYDAVLEFQCNFDDVVVNTYHVQASVVGDYYVGGPDEDVLVVYDPGLGFTTGGGWFYWPGTTEKTNFGYTMKYNKKGTKVQGSLLLIRHVAPGEKYRVKSNALYGLSIGEAGDPVFGWATFSGKCTYKDPTMDEAEGNHEFLVYVEDHGEPGKDVDQFWIEVYDKDDNVIAAMSMDRDAPDNTETLGGGNIVVPHTRASDGSK